MIDERFADAVRRAFGGANDPVPTWMAVAILALMAAIAVAACVWMERRSERKEQEADRREIETTNPVAIKRQPAEIFETDCDLCGCGYRYKVDYVKDFTTVCPHCGTKNPHGPADTDIISRRVPEE